jgi:hypothetical protein
MNRVFKNNLKEAVVATLVSNWGMKKESFYNTPTNKSVEKFWTYNRCLNFLRKLERDYTYNPTTGERVHNTNKMLSWF